MSQAAAPGSRPLAATPRSRNHKSCAALRRPLCCSACPDSACRADVLLVDAQNVLSRAGGHQRRGAANTRHRHALGAGVAGSFADWLQFLAAVAQPQLLVAVFDRPLSQRGKQQQQQQREQLAPEYLQRRRRRQQQQQSQQPGQQQQQQPSTPPPPPSPPPAAGDPLRPFKRQLQQLGGVCLQAAPGWEADDGLAAACRSIQECHPAATLLVASGDHDMQQLLAPRVAWLQLHPQPSLECPLAAELVTAASFQRRRGFPAAAYADWLALVGKREASIRGADVGASTAAKLLARYGSLNAVLAASADGQLKGWGPAVQRFVAGSGGALEEGGTQQREAHLRRNRQLFAVSDEPTVVDPTGMRQLAAALDRLQPGAASAADVAFPSSGCILPTTPALAWQHPLHARRQRRRQSGQQSAAAAGTGSSIADLELAATPQGLAVDELGEAAAGGEDTAGSGGSRQQPCATFHISRSDLASADSWDKAAAAQTAAAAAAATEAQGHPQHADCTPLLLPLLHPGLRHHVKLVQRGGYKVRLQLAADDPAS